MGWMTRVQFLEGAEILSLCHHIQTRPWAHPASYPVGTSSSFPEGKAAGA